VEEATKISPQAMDLKNKLLTIGMVLRTISCVCGRPDELVAVHGVSEYVHVFVDIIGY
jgi:hypothetical protein